MVRDAGSSSEGGLAEWTRDVASLVGTRSHMLTDIVDILKVAVAITAVEMLVVALILLMLNELLQCGRHDCTSRSRKGRRSGCCLACGDWLDWRI